MYMKAMLLKATMYVRAIDMKVMCSKVMHTRTVCMRALYIKALYVNVYYKSGVHGGTVYDNKASMCIVAVYMDVIYGSSSVHKRNVPKGRYTE